MNNRKKMYRANHLVRRWLNEKGYRDIFLFPHTRFFKDIHFRGMSFDGLATTKQGKLALFQIKTNRNPSKPIINKMKELGKELRDIEILWFNKKNKSTKLNVFTSWNGKK